MLCRGRFSNLQEFSTINFVVVAGAEACMSWRARCLILYSIQIKMVKWCVWLSNRISCTCTMYMYMHTFDNISPWKIVALRWQGYDLLLLLLTLTLFLLITISLFLSLITVSQLSRPDYHQSVVSPDSDQITIIITGLLLFLPVFILRSHNTFHGVDSKFTGWHPILNLLVTLPPARNKNYLIKLSIELKNVNMNTKCVDPIAYRIRFWNAWATQHSQI